MCQPSAIEKTGAELKIGGSDGSRTRSLLRCFVRQLIVDLRSLIKVVRERNLAASNQRRWQLPSSDRIISNRPNCLFQNAMRIGLRCCLFHLANI
jgi:hypothetical protein